MQIYYGEIKEEPNYIAWVKCNRKQIEEVRDVIPVDEFELTVAVKPNYDPITCSVDVLSLIHI